MGVSMCVWGVWTAFPAHPPRILFLSPQVMASHPSSSPPPQVHASHPSSTPPPQVHASHPSSSPPPRFMYGEASYNAYALDATIAKQAFSTIFFILYVVLVLLLALNMLTAMIVHTGEQGHPSAPQCRKKAKYVKGVN